MVPKTQHYSLKYLLGLLNSKLFNYYVIAFGKLKRDGYYEYSKNTLSQLPIKKDDDSYLRVVEIVEQILKLKHKNLQACTIELENQIDKLVYKLYGLTEGEIAIIENTVN